MSIYLGRNKIGVTKYENLNPELTEQTEELDGLAEEVNALSDKPTDMLQQMIDQTNSCANLFYRYKGTDLSFIKNLDTSNVTNMNSMFFHCEQATNIDLSNLNTDIVYDMYEMFRSNQLLTAIDVSNFNTSHVENMGGMFCYCYELLELNVSNFNTSRVVNMSVMFRSCRKLKTLDLSNFNTGNVKRMDFMFDTCEELESLNLSNFNTSQVTFMDSMFSNCPKLTSLDLSSFNTSNVKNMSNTFASCTSLTKIIGELNMISLTSEPYNMFSICSNLEEVTLKNIKKSLTMGRGTSYGTLLTNNTLINTIQQLWDLTGSTSQTLTLSTTSKENIANIYVKLVTPTAEEIEADPYINNKKPCVVCESTDEGAMTLTEYATSKNWAIA